MLVYILILVIRVYGSDTKSDFSGMVSPSDIQLKFILSDSKLIFQENNAFPKIPENSPACNRLFR